MRPYRSLILKIGALFTVMLLSLPSMMGMYHALQQHDHFDQCENAEVVHIHEKQIDCQLFDVTLDHAVSFAFAKAESIILLIQTKPLLTVEQLFLDQSVSSIALRGPPVV